MYNLRQFSMDPPLAVQQVTDTKKAKVTSEQK